MKKAGRMPMGEPDAEQIAKAFEESARHHGLILVVKEGRHLRTMLTAVAQDLIDAGHVL